jgi:anti-sigma28 factor (negative regulator of flagellin synthesis)
VNIATSLAGNSLIDLSDSLDPATNTPARTSQQRIDSSSSGADSSMDSISLSSTSSPERQMRLLGIKEALGNGTYDVSASAVADAMRKNRV